MPVAIIPDLPPPDNPAAAPSSCPILPVWCMTVAYGGDIGLRQAPICGPFQTTSRFNRVHGGKGTKFIKWLAIGWGAAPPCPSMNTQQQNEVLTHWTVGLPIPGKSIDGTDVVMFYGEYHYGLQVMPGPNDVLTGGSAPYQSNQSVTVYQLSLAAFNQIFTGPSQAPAAGSGIVITY